MVVRVIRVWDWRFHDLRFGFWREMSQALLVFFSKTVWTAPLSLDWFRTFIYRFGSISIQFNSLVQFLVFLPTLPLTIDNATQNKLFGNYVHILVDMDLSRRLFHEISVEREGFTFKLQVNYEWLLDLCSYCQNIGHAVCKCQWLYPKKSQGR